MEEVVGGSNDMHVAIVNVDHDDASKGGPNVIHCVLHKKKMLKIDNKLWRELAAKAQSMVDDEKNEYSQDITNEDANQGGDCMGLSHIWNDKDCLHMLQRGQSPNDVSKEEMGRITKCVLNYVWHINQLFFLSMYIPKLQERTSLKNCIKTLG